MPGAAPFNWTYSESGAGIAEAGTDGLRVDYYGRAASELASQTIRLRPAAYQLRTEVEGETSNSPSGLAWTLTCAGNGAEVVRLAIGELSYSGRTFATAFTIPALGCEAQSLVLKGVPKEFPVPDSATFKSIAVSGARSR